MRFCLAPTWWIHFSLLYFSLVCVPFFWYTGCAFPKREALCVFYILKFLSPAEAAASQVQYFPYFWGSRGIASTPVQHTLGSIVIYFFFVFGLWNFWLLYKVCSSPWTVMLQPLLLPRELVSYSWVLSLPMMGLLPRWALLKEFYSVWVMAMYALFFQITGKTEKTKKSAIYVATAVFLKIFCWVLSVQQLGYFFVCFFKI